MLEKKQLPFVETMITQVCNLSCTGCTNFSELRHAGYVSWSQGKQWIDSWLQRIDILDFGIMGGEPLINPEWKQWVSGVRTLLPLAQIRFTTNGTLLNRHSDILDFFEDCGNIVFKITVHGDNHDLEETILELFARREWDQVCEFGINRWQGKNNLRLQINRPDVFLKTYKGSIESMQPWNSDHVEAFSQCIQKTCPLLHNGRIYKCSTSALTKEIRKRFNVSDDEWLKFDDPGIAPDSDAGSIRKFIDNFGKPHAMCSQCPSSSSEESRVDHKITVFKK